MNPYDLLELRDYPVKSSLENQIKSIITHLTHIHSKFEDVEHIFMNENHTNMDLEVGEIYDRYGKGLMGLYNCLLLANIRDNNLNDYVDNILRNQQLNDAQYFTSPTGLEKIVRLMVHFDNKEGINHLPGYRVSLKSYPAFRVSSSIAEQFMVNGFKCVSYLYKGLEIIRTGKDTEKVNGQALLIEALFMWIKFGNTLNIVHEKSLE